MIINGIPFWTIKDISETCNLDDRLLADAGLWCDRNRVRRIKDNSSGLMKRPKRSVDPMLAVLPLTGMLQQA